MKLFYCKQVQNNQKCSLLAHEFENTNLNVLHVVGQLILPYMEIKGTTGLSVYTHDESFKSKAWKRANHTTLFNFLPHFQNPFPILIYRIYNPDYIIFCSRQYTHLINMLKNT